MLNPASLKKMNTTNLFDLDTYTKPVAYTDWAVDVESTVLKTNKTCNRKPYQAFKDDSVTQRVVTESTSVSPESDSVTPKKPVTESTVVSPPTPKSTTGVHPYIPKGKARGGHPYYCYTYRAGKRVKNVHIPGGNVTNPVAQARAAEVEAAIEFGRSPGEIVKLIKSWGRRRGK